MSRTRVLAAALAVGLLTTSCFGPFNATRRVYHWNDTVTSDKWAEEGLFLLITIIPVYGLAFVGDVLLFNSIEFWGGQNPVDPPLAQLVDDEGNVRHVTQVWHDGRPALGIALPDGDTLIIAQDADGHAVVLDDQGEVVARTVRGPDDAIAALWTGASEPAAR